MKNSLECLHCSFEQNIVHLKIKLERQTLPWDSILHFLYFTVDDKLLAIDKNQENFTNKNIHPFKKTHTKNSYISSIIPIVPFVKFL